MTQAQKPLLRRLFGWLIPEDKGRDGLGYGPFKLSAEHPFTRAGALHDYEFGLSHQGIPDKTKDHTDCDFFWRMALIARAEQDFKKQCDLIWDIIWLWPTAREGGKLMWDGDPLINKEKI